MVRCVILSDKQTKVVSENDVFLDSDIFLHEKRSPEPKGRMFVDQIYLRIRKYPITTKKLSNERSIREAKTELAKGMTCKTDRYCGGQTSGLGPSLERGGI